MKARTTLALLFAALAPTLAHAHGIAGGGGFAAGFSHPVLGFDHLLAMISVGILSAQMGGRAVWTVPAAFVAAMLLGGILGMRGIPLLSVELAIAFSVLALGVALAVERRMPAMLAMLFVGFFGVFHGHAHGTEMPELVQPVGYSLGFLAGTGTIHLSGVLVGIASKQSARGPVFLRYTGAAIAGIGLHMLLLMQDMA